MHILTYSYHRSYRKQCETYKKIDFENECTLIGYEPADLTVHAPPELPRMGSFFSPRCLVFQKNVLKGKPQYFGVCLG